MSTAVASDDNGEKTGPKGSQTLLRGLDILDQVVDGPIALAELSARMGLTRSTTHRLATALIDRGLLIFMPRKGYRLGPKLLHRSDEHTSELQSLMRLSYAVFCFKKK